MKADKFRLSLKKEVALHVDRDKKALTNKKTIQNSKRVVAMVLKRTSNETALHSLIAFL